MIVPVDKIALLIQHQRETAGHPRPEIVAGWSEHGDHASRHVFAGHAFLVVRAIFEGREAAKGIVEYLGI